jgi:hypothetical protein
MMSRPLERCRNAYTRLKKNICTYSKTEWVELTIKEHQIVDYQFKYGPEFKIDTDIKKLNDAVRMVDFCNSSDNIVDPVRIKMAKSVCGDFTVRLTGGMIVNIAKS